MFFLAIASTTAQASKLTLEDALATADSNHPDILYAQAERDSAYADIEIINSRQDTNVNLEGILRSGKPTIGNQELANDNSFRLTARKTLFDFGRSSNAEAAAQFELKAREANLITALDKHRIEIMRRYFDVLLADLRYIVDNELFAVYAVDFQRGEDRFALGQISSIDLSERESRFRDMAEKRSISGQRQRITRTLLVNAMNRPNDLSVELEDPGLPGNQRLLPDYEELLPMLLVNNQRLNAQQKMLAASQNRIDSLRAEKSPVLDAELQAADYSRSSITRDTMSAGLILSWPLYQGNRQDSRVAREVAQFNKLQASAEKLKMELTQALLETYLDITQLQGAARIAAKKNTELRDLQLERSRGLYEMEIKSNLGTSMAGTSESKLRERQVEYQLALSFARLEALIGKPLSQTGKIQRN